MRLAGERTHKRTHFLRSPTPPSRGGKFALKSLGTFQRRIRPRSARSTAPSPNVQPDLWGNHLPLDMQSCCPLWGWCPARSFSLPAGANPCSCRHSRWLPLALAWGSMKHRFAAHASRLQGAGLPTTSRPVLAAQQHFGLSFSVRAQCCH